MPPSSPSPQKPMSKRTTPGLINKSVFPAGILALHSKRATGPIRGGIMHPMFVKLYLEPEADDDEAAKRRRANRARRQRARTLVRVTASEHGRPRPGSASVS
jgi:hypothetical protein